MKKIPIIVIVGPTASGKTELSVNIAKKIGAEIISADSMQIYKNMHIASAAADEEEKAGIPHHLLEFLKPEEGFSVADFVKAAADAVADINGRKRPIVLVGGTGLYINSFIDNITFSDEPLSAQLRDELNKKYDRVGGEQMLKELSVFDPETAQRLHPNNKKRIIRAFELYLSTGNTMTHQLEESRKAESPYLPYIIGITYKDREKLYSRINLRVEKMMEAGLLREAEEAFNRKNAATAAQAIGHKEFFPYFSGQISLEEAVEALKMSTRRYAKRQLTWFRRDERVNWIYRDETEDTLAQALKILERNGYFEQAQ